MKPIREFCVGWKVNRITAKRCKASRVTRVDVYLNAPGKKRYVSVIAASMCECSQTWFHFPGMSTNSIASLEKAAIGKTIDSIVETEEAAQGLTVAQLIEAGPDRNTTPKGWRDELMSVRDSTVRIMFTDASMYEFTRCVRSCCRDGWLDIQVDGPDRAANDLVNELREGRRTHVVICATPGLEPEPALEEYQIFCIGRPILYVETKAHTQSQFTDSITLVLGTGTDTLTLDAAAECCSVSWFHFLGADDLTVGLERACVGKTIRSIVLKQDSIDLPKTMIQMKDRNHLVRITFTDGSVFDLVLRNSSNGDHNGLIDLSWRSLGQYWGANRGWAYIGDNSTWFSGCSSDEYCPCLVPQEYRWGYDY